MCINGQCVSPAEPPLSCDSTCAQSDFGCIEYKLFNCSANNCPVMDTGSPATCPGTRTQVTLVTVDGKTSCVQMNYQYAPDSQGNCQIIHRNYTESAVRAKTTDVSATDGSASTEATGPSTDGTAAQGGTNAAASATCGPTLDSSGVPCLRPCSGSPQCHWTGYVCSTDPGNGIGPAPTSNTNGTTIYVPTGQPLWATVVPVAAAAPVAPSITSSGLTASVPLSIWIQGQNLASTAQANLSYIDDQGDTILRTLPMTASSDGTVGVIQLPDSFTEGFGPSCGNPSNCPVSFYLTQSGNSSNPSSFLMPTLKATVATAPAVASAPVDPNVAVVTSLYQTLLNRTPDAGDIAYWVNILDSGAQTLAQVRQDFLTSPEYLSGASGAARSCCAGRLYAEAS